MTTLLSKIEKAVPLPKTKTPTYFRFPFGDMQPGDSFLVPHFVPNTRSRTEGFEILDGALAQARKRHPDWVFVTRRIGSTWADHGTRVWREK